MDDLEKRKVRILIKELEKIRGSHTELVSVYVPAGYNLNKVMEQVKNEQSTAQNIKSKTVRKNVMSALERIIQHLKLYRETPPKGLILFSGNVSDKEGVADIELWNIDPPEPVRQKIYWCGQNFIVDPLVELIQEKELYGLIVLDKSEADIGLLSGKRVISLKHMDSIVPGKTKAGGWSANRYARIREGLLEDFMKKVGETATEKFKEFKDMKGVLVGGPGPVKEMFAERNYLNYELKKIIIGIINISYTGDYGLKELVDKSEDLIQESSAIKEKKILDRFFGEFAKDSGMAIYGFNEVMAAMDAGNLDTLLLSEEFDWVNVDFECLSCGDKANLNVPRTQIKEKRCVKCGGEFKIIQEKDIMENIIERATDMGVKVELISTDSSKGVQLKELGGIAGILRYKQQ